MEVQSVTFNGPSLPKWSSSRYALRRILRHCSSLNGKVKFFLSFSPMTYFLRP